MEGRPSRSPFPASRVLLLTIGIPRRALRRCFEGAWEKVGFGHNRYKGTISFVHLDLLRLPVTEDTAWAHVAGESPYLDEAIALIVKGGATEPERLLYDVSNEVRIMPELRKSSSGRVEQTGAYRFAKAWELAMSRREGLEKGRQEGLQKGRQEGLLTGLRKGRQYGKIQALESLLGLPETPLDALASMSPEEIGRRVEELSRQVRMRIS